MSNEANLNIAEIAYESGGIKFRYTRMLSPDGTRWIRHGLFVAYHENGTIASEGDYVQGKEEGVWRDFHESGKPAAEGAYLGGEKHGRWRYWREDGSEEAAETY
ncbi:toxin-antitoxin system YwqK family antitoxin [Burkholderia sp. Ac-20379]|uniref:toxin-antitoxin system YwqK family antitoxin n=1 Tax=Burkholderia sp. Ac-20379 TaxID=2703900 RepID=UPI00197F2C60|nr:hypothetical protein [Burkholderia sp. Ac-20379]MBN3724654.1 hypothetical protein [Burkholderia sp. Ac-20379]